MSNQAVKDRFNQWRNSGAPAIVAKRQPAPLSLARVGWMGFPNSHAPHGELTKRHQAKWISEPIEDKRATVQTKRGKKESPLTRIAKRWESPTYRSETKRVDLYHA